MTTIYGLADCQNCKMAKAAHPNWGYVVLEPNELITVGKILGVKSLPIIIETGD